VQSPAAASDGLAPSLAGASALAEALAAVLGAVVAPPPPQAATRIAVMPAIVASFRIPMRVFLLLVTDGNRRRTAGTAA